MVFARSTRTLSSRWAGGSLSPGVDDPDISAADGYGQLGGEGGTHAWVQVVRPAPHRVEILAWDPTHDRPADLRYLTVAVGRDYHDVAPVSGTYSGACAGRLTT